MSGMPRWPRMSVRGTRVTMPTAAPARESAERHREHAYDTDAKCNQVEIHLPKTCNKVRYGTTFAAEIVGKPLACNTLLILGSSI